MNSGDSPTVTVVIGSNAPPERLAACLEALESQREGVEVLVHEARPSPPALRERFPWADFVESPGALVPHLWRDGIDRAGGELVALTIAQMVPAPDWVSTIRRLLAKHDVVGGAIDPGERLRLVDWGEYFCRYARDMRPFQARSNVDIPCDNAVYRRSLLQAIEESYREGFWESVAHRRLAAEGIVLWDTPDLVVRQGRSAGFNAFVRQRLTHGRLYGHQRGVHFGRLRNLIGVLAAPAVPPLMTARMLRHVFGKRRGRGRALLALPYIVAFNVVWAYAEARGHLDMLLDERT
jgi:hypothetical protein